MLAVIPRSGKDGPRRTITEFLSTASAMRCSNTIGGGTNEIQRTLVAVQGLGLPR
jgi:hypothetical protein